MNVTADKGAAVRRLQRDLGITPAQTMVFGDYLNDLEMLDTAEWSVATTASCARSPAYCTCRPPEPRPPDQPCMARRAPTSLGYSRTVNAARTQPTA